MCISNLFCHVYLSVCYARELHNFFFFFMKTLCVCNLSFSLIISSSGVFCLAQNSVFTVD